MDVTNGGLVTEITTIVPYTRNSTDEIHNLVLWTNILPSCFRQNPFVILWDDIMSLKQRGFFRVFGSCSLLAFVGTIILLRAMIELDESGLKNSLPTLVMSFFSYFLVIFTSTSCFRVFIFNPTFKRRYLYLPMTAVAMHFAKNQNNKRSISLYFFMDVFWASSENGGNGLRKYLMVYSFWTTQLWMFEFEHIERLDFSPDLVLAVSISIAAMCSAIPNILHSFTFSLPSSHIGLDQRINRLVPLAAARVTNIYLRLKEKKSIGMLIRYGVGLGGTVLFQNFFQLATFNQVMAFVLLAYVWLINLTLVSASSDFGILSFLCANMIAGSAVNQFGLGVTTWLAYGICILLYELRLLQKYRILSSTAL